MEKENSSYLTASSLFICLFATDGDCFWLKLYSTSQCVDCHNKQNYKLLAAPVSWIIFSSYRK
jgi:hypothetical protein